MKYLSLLLFIATSSLAQPYDLVIRNGRLVDGTGNPWYYADVAVQNGRIARIGTIPASEGKRVIDARRQIVAPGFIDVHTHLESSLDNQPSAENFVYGGVTTLITGNCGASRTDLRILFDSLRLKGVSPNIASLVGHNSVRL